MNNERELLKALQEFKTKITIDTVGKGFDILNNTVAQNVKIAYYLSDVSGSMTTYCGRSTIELDVSYQNTDVPLSDIYIVSRKGEINSILCQYIGSYKQRLILFASPSINVDAEYEKFSVVNAPFYPNFVSLNITKGQSSLSPMSYYDFIFNYRIGKAVLAMMEHDTKAEVKRIANKLFLPGMNDETKAFLAHNYLAHMVEYTLKEDASRLETSYRQSAYGALIQKKCVCQGYAEAFKRLMDYAGIQCDIVCGETKGYTTAHAWNILKLHNELENFHIDVTWDSVGDKVSFKYFGLRDSDFEGERTWNRQYNVKCTSSRDLLRDARADVMRYKAQLISNGVSYAIMGY